MRYLIFLGILLVCGASYGAGGVYKWVDKDGKVHYGDPPATTGAAEAQPIDKSGSKAGGTTAKGGRLLTDREWDSAVERADKSGGGYGRNIAVPGVRPAPPPPPPIYSSTYSGGRSSTPYSSALSQNEAERRRAAAAQAREEAEQKRRENLIAECERARGTDCRSERAIQYQDAQNRGRVIIR